MSGNEISPYAVIRKLIIPCLVLLVLFGLFLIYTQWIRPDPFRACVQLCLGTGKKEDVCLFQCQDGHVFIATLMDTLWRRLAKAIGHEDLIDDPDLQNDYSRFENRHKIDPLVAEWCSQRTVDEVLKELEKARIPCGPCLGLDKVAHDPHIKETNMIEYIDLEEPGLNNVPICGIPVRMSKTPGKVVTRAPRVGEHNREIYQDLLGYSEEKIAKLKTDDVI